MKRRFAKCAVEITKDISAPGAVQLFPEGDFTARDGRPGAGKSWRLTEAAAGGIIRAAARRTTPIVIDYEHQTLEAKNNGREAPAAGWFKALEWRAGKGLFATDVDWTAAAKAYIDAGEYRYISPVFSYGADGTVLELHMAGLTNNPAIDGMDAVTAATFSMASDGLEDTMEELRKLLGLPDDATYNEIVAAVKALKETADTLKETADAVNNAAAKAETPDPAKYVPIATLTEVRNDLAALSAQVRDKEVSGLVDAALADGRLLPAMKGWALDLGKKDIVALKAYIDKAQPIAALTGTQTGGNAPTGGGGALDDTALAVCRQMGVSADDYKKTLGAA